MEVREVPTAGRHMSPFIVIMIFTPQPTMIGVDNDNMVGVDIADQNATCCMPIINAKRPTRNVFMGLLLIGANNTRDLCAACHGLRSNAFPMKGFVRDLSSQMIEAYVFSSEYIPPPRQARCRKRKTVGCREFQVAGGSSYSHCVLRVGNYPTTAGLERAEWYGNMMRHHRWEIEWRVHQYDWSIYAL